MWLNEAVSRNSYTDYVRKQKLELQEARKRNGELLKKCEHLEHEQAKLNNLIISNQVEVITKKNHLNAVLADLKDQKKLNLTATQRLEICKEQINIFQDNIEQSNGGIYDSITELEPIKEKLSFKWDVVECLQEKLVETRLQNAEKEALIIELKQYENDLTDEIRLLKDDKKATLPISLLQEQFLAARLQEADVVLEFDKLKRSLAIIKEKLKEKKKETDSECNKQDEDLFHIRFNLRDKYHEQLKLQEDASIAKTVQLQNEIDHLKMQIKKLEDTKLDITGRLYFNEEVKVHLHEVQTSIFLRLQKTNKELEGAIERNRKLEGKMVRDLLDVQHRTDDKDVVISQLAEEIQDLQSRNEKFAKSNDESMASMNEDTVNKLQDEIKFLEEKVKLLSNYREMPAH